MSHPPVYKISDLYTTAKKLVHACYELVQELPEDEKGLSGQKLKMAVLSAYLYITQGLATKQKKKFFKRAKHDLVLVDGLLEIYREINLVAIEKLDGVNYLLVQSLELLKKPSTKS